MNLIHIFYSGSKGFHLELPKGLFGYEPSIYLNEIFKVIAAEHLLPQEVTIDDSVYDKVRLWRVKNTKNSKSGLLKIPLSVHELFNLTIPEIQELAKQARKGDFCDPNVSLNDKLHEIYLEVEKKVKSLGSNNSKKKKKYKKSVDDDEIIDGDRNNVLLSWWGYFLDKGIPFKKALFMLRGINMRCTTPDGKPFVLDDDEVIGICERAYSYEGAFEFNTLSWEELIGLEEPEIEFLIQDLLPTSCLILIAGKPKLGKSLLALYMALCVGNGLSLWEKKVTKGKVLFISTEDGHVRLKKRVWKMLGNPKEHKPQFEFYVGECVLTKPEVFGALQAKVEEFKPQLIVLDPLINLFRDKELNSAEDMNEVLRPLQTLAKEHNASVLVIHHARKSGSDESIDTVQGSITIGGVADGLLILKNLRSENEEKKATLEVILKDAEIPQKVVLKLDERLRWDIEGNFEEVESNSLEKQVIEALQQEPSGLTISDLMKILDSTYKPIYKLMLRLEKEEKVKFERIGKAHSKIYTLFDPFPRGKRRESERESEKSGVTNGNDSENEGGNSSLSHTRNGESEMFRRESEVFKGHSEGCDCEECVPKTESPDPWEIET
ncbi:MAG TPA: AAA family ATPase [Thermodesulfobacteriota bacterium]|nr:AAA family ATPase [Thermodesulfobacteriota bacterium]